MNYFEERKKLETLERCLMEINEQVNTLLCEKDKIEERILKSNRYICLEIAIFQRSIKSKLKESKSKQIDLAVASHVSKQAVSKWVSMKSVMSRDNYVKAIKFFERKTLELVR